MPVVVDVRQTTVITVAADETVGVLEICFRPSIICGNLTKFISPESATQRNFFTRYTTIRSRSDLAQSKESCIFSARINLGLPCISAKRILQKVLEITRPGRIQTTNPPGQGPKAQELRDRKPTRLPEDERRCSCTGCQASRRRSPDHRHHGRRR